MYGTCAWRGYTHICIYSFTSVKEEELTLMPLFPIQGHGVFLPYVPALFWQ